MRLRHLILSMLALAPTAALAESFNLRCSSHPGDSDFVLTVSSSLNPLATPEIRALLGPPGSTAGAKVLAYTSDLIQVQMNTTMQVAGGLPAVNGTLDLRIDRNTGQVVYILQRTDGTTLVNYDIRQALKAGYSAEEVTDYLMKNPATTNYDVRGALTRKLSAMEITDYLSSFQSSEWTGNCHKEDKKF